jgi:hypothetical protein
MSFTNCTPSSLAQSSTAYFDSNYEPLGVNSVGVNYGVYVPTPNLPTSVKVGDTGIVGTMNLYTNSTKSTNNGTSLVSYIIEADTSSTAIVNVITKLYNTSQILTATEQTRYRIDALGTFSPISTDIQYANGSTSHLVLTFQ